MAVVNNKSIIRRAPVENSICALFLCTFHRKLNVCQYIDIIKGIVLTDMREVATLQTILTHIYIYEYGGPESICFLVDSNGNVLCIFNAIQR